VHLSPKSLDLLKTLVDARPKAVSKELLQAALWPRSFVSEGNLNVLVSEIRRVLDDDARAPRFVRTVPRFGYAFVAETRTAEAAAAPPGAGSHWLIWGRRKFELLEGESVVGRDPHCEIHLDVPGVSRRHARLRATGVLLTIEDLASKNGTQVGDRRVTQETAVSDNDLLRFGPVAVRYRYWPGVESTVSSAGLAD
jgi:pSer/pThr/pTyr-binding forkhead associated (FHA) protein